MNTATIKADLEGKFQTLDASYRQLRKQMEELYRQQHKLEEEKKAIIGEVILNRLGTSDVVWKAQSYRGEKDGFTLHTRLDISLEEVLKGWDDLSYHSSLELDKELGVHFRTDDGECQLSMWKQNSATMMTFIKKYSLKVDFSDLQKQKEVAEKSLAFLSTVLP